MSTSTTESSNPTDPIDPAAGVAALSRAGTALAGRVGPSIVSIGTDGRGTGVIIATDRVLTNAHHLRDRTTSVTFGDGVKSQGTAIAVDADGDLAVISVPTGDRPAASWAEGPLLLGSVIFALGRGGGDLRISFGLVSGSDRSFHSGTGHLVTGAIEHSAPLSRGSSGGPVVDIDGHIVAITTRRERSGFSLARPADDRLRERVTELVAGRSTPRRRLGVALASEAVASHLRASVGLSPRAGLLVRSVSPDSPAARAGITEGDLLVAAGGTPLARPEDLHHALSTAGESVSLTVVRGDVERQVVAAFTSAAEALGEPDLTA